MSEPSPEAKKALWDEAIKAASAKGFFSGMVGGPLDAAFAEGYCTATAKLREELEQTKAECKELYEALYDVILTPRKQLAHQQSSACPKCGYKSCLDLRSPSLQQPVKAQQPSGDADIKAEGIRRFQAQLAHQQPSAITTNEQAYRDGTLSQPSVCPKCGYKSWPHRHRGDSKACAKVNFISKA